MSEHGSERPHVEDPEELSGRDLELLVKDIYSHPEKIREVDPSQHQRLVEVMFSDGAYKFIANNIDVFSSLNHNETARLLIEKGYVDTIERNIEKFSGLNSDTALLLIDKGKAGTIVRHFENFTHLDADVANVLIKKGYTDEVASKLEHFFGLDSSVAHTLIVHGKVRTVTFSLQSFSNLNANIAQLIVDKEKDWITSHTVSSADFQIYDHLSSFSGAAHNKIANLFIERERADFAANSLHVLDDLDAGIARLLIEKGFVEPVAKNLDKFTGLNADIARLLIGKGKYGYVTQNLDKFSNLDQNNIARFMIEKGGANRLGSDLELFTSLDRNRDLARFMIEKGAGHGVCKYLETFTSLDHKEIVQLLFENEQGDEVAEFINKFSGIDQNGIAHLLIRKEFGGVRGDNVIFRLLRFKGIDAEIARFLIEKGKGREVVEHIRNFSVLDHNKILRLLFENGLGDDVVKNFDEFTGLNADTARFFIEKGESNRVTNNLDKFSGLDPGIARLLIEQDFAEQVSLHLDKFSNLDSDIACLLVEKDWGTRVIDNLDKFTGLDYNEIARLLIERGDGNIVARYLDKFTGLDSETALLLIRHGQQRVVMEQRSRFALEQATPEQREVFDFYEDETVPRKIRESKEVSQFLNKHFQAKVLDKLEPVPDLDPAALRARLTVGVPPAVYGRIKHAGGQPESASPDELIYQWSNEFTDNEGDLNISGQLGNGYRRFGARVMLDYLRTVDVSEHDALHFMPDIIALQERSGVSPDKFGASILVQVGRDGASYAEGSAHHRFASVCKELSGIDPTAVYETAKKYTKVRKLQELMADIDKESFASSWKTLKKTYELVQLMRCTGILDELNSEEMDPRMREYVGKLAFHPNISTEAVITFWKDPAKFLDVDDHHTAQRINEVKKPSNYVSRPYLGLTAENLRDAYVLGEMDRLQTLPPMERTYNLGAPEQEDLTRTDTVHAFLRRALGREREGIKGEGKNPKKIFNKLREFCLEHSCNLPDLLDPEKGRAIVAELPSEAVEQLREITFDKNSGMKQPKVKGETYRIRIGAKSDPDMAVAGNDTASCMPFGSGKNNVYMFNPNCTQLVLERLQKDGSWRTAAQSVMTIDAVASRPTSELIKQYTQEGHLSDLITEEDLLRTPVVTCDNIEIAKNEEGERRHFVREAYERYFREYLSAHASVLGLDATRVAIGSGYTPANFGFKEVPNTFVPQAPMGYSDNVHEKAYLIETGLKPLETKLQQGMTPLSTRDTLAVAMIEGKAYKDNESLLTNLHNMQNGIIGMEIANAHFERPNLSSLYRDAKGIPRGYMLAYEGVNGGLPEVYIDDLASDRTNRMAGGRLINRFFESYLANYGTEQRPFIPIYTNARESTSYPILKANVERLAERAGLVAEMVETGTYKSGSDIMHNMRIHIARSREDLAAQKARYAGVGEAADESSAY